MVQKTMQHAIFTDTTQLDSRAIVVTDEQKVSLSLEGVLSLLADCYQLHQFKNGIE